MTGERGYQRHYEQADERTGELVTHSSASRSFVRLWALKLRDSRT
jgi:hypothetical protein